VSSHVIEANIRFAFSVHHIDTPIRIIIAIQIHLIFPNDVFVFFRALIPFPALQHIVFLDLSS
jgi:hypothetical protein